ncbi:hypothetical protein E2C01_007503 [Portunus trituberculatus]|uniref:Uncharacterized protein n=1 Tax=Portunus trituberculatus TaxID=210409 RepID=A0A5B7CYD1_PORTR|nr:hypothetical protein [Portunus trituberculatus]
MSITPIKFPESNIRIVFSALLLKSITASPRYTQGSDQHLATPRAHINTPPHSRLKITTPAPSLLQHLPCISIFII